MGAVNHTLEKGPANLQSPLKPKPVRQRERWQQRRMTEQESDEESKENKEISQTSEAEVTLNNT